VAQGSQDEEEGGRGYKADSNQHRQEYKHEQDGQSEIQCSGLRI